MPKGNKKKKIPHNAFFFYMRDFREQQEARGIFYASQKEVADAAAPSWHLLSTEEREPYQIMAKEAKERDQLDLNNKFTTEGKSYAQVNREEQECNERKEKMMYEIRGTIKSLRSPPALNNYPFHLVHVNYYCKTHSGLYVPCEMAVSEFTLQDGIRRLFHVLINPGELPLGYRYEAEVHSKETHQMPMPSEFQFDGVIKDYTRIFASIRSFLRDAKAEYKLPPLYTINSQLEPCESVLANLCDSVNEDNMFRVYPAKEMFFELQHACVEVFEPDDLNVVKLPFVSLAERELEKDVFDYAKGISCSFHEDTDAICHCSLSCVQRWSFLILDMCHQVTKMPLIPGKHVPLNTKVSNLNRLSKPVLQQKTHTDKLNSAMQNLHVQDSEKKSHPCSSSENPSKYMAAATAPFRAPKQLSEASCLYPEDSDD